MTKINELTVADLRGARDQIERHVIEAKSIEKINWLEFSHKRNGFEFAFHTGEHGTPSHVSIREHATYDADWTEFMDKVWKRVSQIPSKEVREIRSVMSALGGAIEVLDKSTSEFATELTARLKGLRDEAGARLITYQGAE